MREGFSRTTRTWGSIATRGGRATRGSRVRGSRVSRNVSSQHSMKVLDVSELQNSFKANISSSEVPGTGTISSRNILPQKNFLAWDAPEMQVSDENRISSWEVSDISGSRLS